MAHSLQIARSKKGMRDCNPGKVLCAFEKTSTNAKKLFACGCYALCRPGRTE